MKRLLLLFILSPVISFGQMRPGALVDSIKASATDLKAVSDLISKNQRTKVDHIQASDSGEYVTIVVRVRVLEAVIIPGLPCRPITGIKTSDLAASIAGMINVPPFSISITDGYTIAHIPMLASILFSRADIVAGKAKVATVPPMPYIPSEIIDTIPLIAAINLLIKDDSVGKMDTVAVHLLEERKMSIADMHLSDAGYSLLEKLEGFSPNLYALKDGGLTIGFGFFVPYHEGRKWNKGVTWEEAERIMREKVPQYEDQVKQYINVPLTQTEFDALTMMAYNLGGFSKATSIVNDINSEADFEKLQKDWMRFVHSKAPGVMKGLMNRRKDELKVRNASDYQPERKIQILKNIK